MCTEHAHTHGSLFSCTEAFCDQSAPIMQKVKPSRARVAWASVTLCRDMRYLAVNDVRTVLECQEPGGKGAYTHHGGEYGLVAVSEP